MNESKGRAEGAWLTRVVNNLFGKMKEVKGVLIPFYFSPRSHGNPAKVKYLVAEEQLADHAFAGNSAS